jgi:DNA-binding NtrC family response regulator
MKEEIKVLVVDDQEGIRKLLAETCSLLGYEVYTAASGQEALAMTQKNYFQVALVDMKMPGMNGIDTMRMLLETVNGIKGIMMTGYGETDFVGEANQLGIAGFLQKPFNLQEIQKILEKVISK